ASHSAINYLRSQYLEGIFNSCFHRTLGSQIPYAPCTEYFVIRFRGALFLPELVVQTNDPATVNESRDTLYGPDMLIYGKPVGPFSRFFIFLAYHFDRTAS